MASVEQDGELSDAGQDLGPWLQRGLVGYVRAKTLDINDDVLSVELAIRDLLRLAAGLEGNAHKFQRVPVLHVVGCHLGNLNVVAEAECLGFCVLLKPRNVSVRNPPRGGAQVFKNKGLDNGDEALVPLFALANGGLHATLPPQHPRDSKLAFVRRR